MSKSVCFDRSSRLTAATLLKSPRCRIFNPTHLKRLAPFVRGCAPRNQNVSQKRLSRVTCLRPSCPKFTLTPPENALRSRFKYLRSWRVTSRFARE